MQKIYINMPSVTFAMKSEKLLRANQIDSIVVKTPSKFSSCGCGYSVIVDFNNLENAKQILYNHNIKINDIQSAGE